MVVVPYSLSGGSWMSASLATILALECGSDVEAARRSGAGSVDRRVSRG